MTKFAGIKKWTSATNSPEQILIQINETKYNSCFDKCSCYDIFYTNYNSGLLEIAYNVYTDALALVITSNAESIIQSIKEMALS